VAYVNLNKILGHHPLTSAVRTVASGVPDPFPKEFAVVKPQNRILGNQAEHIRLDGQRQTARLTVYGAPARRHGLMDVASQPMKLLHSHEDFPIDVIRMQNLRSFEKWAQDKGIDWLGYQVDEGGKRHGNARVITKASTLAYGALYWNATGDLLPSSSGAIETFDFNIPATHKNQINGIITVPWSLVQANIPGNVRSIMQYSRDETGMEIETALYGKNVVDYFLRNDLMQPFLVRNNYNQQMMDTNEVPSGMLGIKTWKPVYQTLYKDQNGTLQHLWNDDLIVFCPAIDQPNKMTWWQAYEGSYPVPKSLNIPRGPDMSNFETEYGQFGYAKPNPDVPSYDVHHGDTWLYAPENEKALFQAIVNF
jgi:hypothetical protein